MAWIYFQESAESRSHSNPGSEQSLIVKETDTLSLSCFQECGQATSTERQYGMTSQHSKDQCSPELTLFSVGSPARTSAVLDMMAEAWTASEADYFLKSCDLLMRFDRNSFSWKMCQLSLAEDLAASPQKFPSSGMIVDGRLYQPLKLVPRTYESAGSCLLPTPTASSCGSNQGGAAGRVGKIRYSLSTMASKNLWPEKFATPQARDFRTGQTKRFTNPKRSKNLNDQIGGKLNPQFVEWLMNFPQEWTALNASVIPWFQSKRVKRSKDSPESSDAA